MQDAFAQFQSNIGRVRDMVGIAGALRAQTTTAVDLSDLLRATMVLAVSALDHYIHELTRKGMLQIAAGVRPPTDAYLRFSVSLRSVAVSQSTSGPIWLDQEIREKHGWLSFQEPSKIADALRHITPKELWKEVGQHLSMSPSDAKRQLRLICDRRNKIAHEADADPTVPGVRWPISMSLVEDAIEFLDKLSIAILRTVA